MITFSIKPSEFLADRDASFVRRGNWLTFKVCPFCGGGDHSDIQTFIVHAADGNFSCSRGKCGASGNFWKLIEFYGRNPRDYTDGNRAQEKTKKKRFIYGR